MEFVREYLRKLSLIVKARLGRVHYTELTEVFEIVNKEGDRIINEIMSKENGTFIVEPAYPATYNEDGSIKEEAVPAVYFDASDTNFLINSLTSDLLDVATVYADYNAK